MLSFSAVYAQSGHAPRLTWALNDGNEGDVMRALLDKFETANPDIQGARWITVGIVDWHPQEIARPDSGRGGDHIARLTAFTSMTAYYLDMRSLVKDADYWNKGGYCDAGHARPAGITGRTGYFTTHSPSPGPFINKTLFDRAQIAAVPSNSDKPSPGRGMDGHRQESLPTPPRALRIAIDPLRSSCGPAMQRAQLSSIRTATSPSIPPAAISPTVHSLAPPSNIAYRCVDPAIAIAMRLRRTTSSTVSWSSTTTCPELAGQQLRHEHRRY